MMQHLPFNNDGQEIFMEFLGKKAFDASKEDIASLVQMYLMEDDLISLCILCSAVKDKGDICQEVSQLIETKLKESELSYETRFILHFAVELATRKPSPMLLEYKKSKQK